MTKVQRSRSSTIMLCQMFPVKASRVCSSNMVLALPRRATYIPKLLSSTQQCSKERSELRSMMGRSLFIAPDRTFPRCPGDRHTLDENASKTEPAKLLAVFVVDTDEKTLLTPIEKVK